MVLGEHHHHHHHHLSDTQSSMLSVRQPGFLHCFHPVHAQGADTAYEAISAELDRLAELGGSSRPRQLEHGNNTGGARPQPLKHAGGFAPSGLQGSQCAVISGPAGHALPLSGLRQAGFLDATHHPLQSATTQQSYASIGAELDRLAQLGGSSKPREVHLGTLLPLGQDVAARNSPGLQCQEGGDGDDGQDKGTRFKPLSILVPDCAATPTDGKKESLPAGARSGVQGAGTSQGHSGAATTPGASIRAILNLSIGNSLPEGLALPSPAMSPLMYGQDPMDFSSFLLSARGTGHLSDLKGGSLWSPSSGSTGLEPLARAGHLGGFSDEAEGDDAEGSELDGNGGGGDSGGLMVMGRSLSRAALSTLEHQEQENTSAGKAKNSNGPSHIQQQQRQQNHHQGTQGTGVSGHSHAASGRNSQQPQQHLQQPFGDGSEGSKKVEQQADGSKGNMKEGRVPWRSL